MRCLKTTRDAIITDSRVSNEKNRCSGLGFTSWASGNSQQGKHGNQDYHRFLKNQLQGGMNRWSIWDFQESETILYDVLMMGICYDTFVKTHRMGNIRVNTNVNYAF